MHPIYIWSLAISWLKRESRQLHLIIFILSFALYKHEILCEFLAEWSKDIHGRKALSKSVFAFSLVSLIGLHGTKFKWLNFVLIHHLYIHVVIGVSWLEKLRIYMAGFESSSPFGPWVILHLISYLSHSLILVSDLCDTLVLFWFSSLFC